MRVFYICLVGEGVRDRKGARGMTSLLKSGVSRLSPLSTCPLPRPCSEEGTRTLTHRRINGRCGPAPPSLARVINSLHSVLRAQRHTHGHRPHRFSAGGSRAAMSCHATPSFHPHPSVPYPQTIRIRTRARRSTLLPHRADPPLPHLDLLGLGLCDALGKELGVLILPWSANMSISPGRIGKHTAATLVASARRRLSATRWRLCCRR